LTEIRGENANWEVRLEVRYGKGLPPDLKLGIDAPNGGPGERRDRQDMKSPKFQK